MIASRLLYLSGPVPNRVDLIWDWRDFVDDYVRRTYPEEMFDNGVQLIFPVRSKGEFRKMHGVYRQKVIPARDIADLVSVSCSQGAVLMGIFKEAVEHKGYFAGTMVEGCICRRELGTPVFVSTDMESIANDAWINYISEGRVQFSKDREFALTKNIDEIFSFLFV